MTPELAKEVCIEAHKEQYRYDGTTPYSSHPIAVANLLFTDDEKIVAYLHDVIEDCPDYTLKQLSNRHWLVNNSTSTRYPISKQIHDALKAITHKPSQSYEDYIQSVCLNKLAAKVKLADITHNLSCCPKKPDKYLNAVEQILKTL